MATNAPNITKNFVLNNRYGLHARPSSLFVKTASQFQSDFTVRKEGVMSNGKSIMDLMILAAAPGDSLTIEIAGEDAQEAMKAIEALFESKFGEE